MMLVDVCGAAIKEGLLDGDDLIYEIIDDPRFGPILKENTFVTTQSKEFTLSISPTEGYPWQVIYSLEELILEYLTDEYWDEDTPTIIARYLTHLDRLREKLQDLATRGSGAGKENENAGSQI